MKRDDLIFDIIEKERVYRDAMGGIGTPTSDNERTKLEAGTTHLLTIINGYSGKEGLQDMINVKKNVPKDKSGNVIAVYLSLIHI